MEGDAVRPRRALQFLTVAKVLFYLDFSSGPIRPRTLLRVPAWGGPARPKSNGPMVANPTPPGRYIIYGVETYRTQTWPYSRIPWGTRLLDKPELKDIWYEFRPNQWASLTKDWSTWGYGTLTREDIINDHYQLYGQKSVPATWVFNDFGPLAIRFFKDTNHNGILDQNEKLSGEMIHTTPKNEAQYRRHQPVTLEESHGCIHIAPRDRDQLNLMGAFTRGTPLVIIAI